MMMMTKEELIAVLELIMIAIVVIVLVRIYSSIRSVSLHSDLYLRTESRHRPEMSNDAHLPPAYVFSREWATKRERGISHRTSLHVIINVTEVMVNERRGLVYFSPWHTFSPVRSPIF